MYGHKTWVLTQFDIFRLSAFERKILRKIHGPIIEREEWRIRYTKKYISALQVYLPTLHYQAKYPGEDGQGMYRG
jgi:hypothetical protein